MKRRLIETVSLDALRVFETTGRLMSFSAAARDLSVTQAAVSRRIKHLEDMLGFQLYRRNGRQLTLTAKGERLLVRMQTALAYLGTELDELAATAPETFVTLAAPAAVSHLWLGPVLHRFHGTYPEVSVKLTTTDNLSELAQSESDLAIVFSKGTHPEWRLTPLLDEVLIPVVSPLYLERVGLSEAPEALRPEDLPGLHLLDYSRSGVNSVTLQDWLDWAAPGCAPFVPRVVFSSYAMAVEAALRGEGVILGSRALVGAHLESGSLVALTRHDLKTGFGYYLGEPRHRSPGHDADLLSSCLLARSFA